MYFDSCFNTPIADRTDSTWPFINGKKPTVWEIVKRTQTLCNLTSKDIHFRSWNYSYLRKSRKNSGLHFGVLNLNRVVNEWILSFVCDFSTVKDRFLHLIPSLYGTKVSGAPEVRHSWGTNLETSKTQRIIKKLSIRKKDETKDGSYPK